MEKSFLTRIAEGFLALFAIIGLVGTLYFASIGLAHEWPAMREGRVAISATPTPTEVPATPTPAPTATPMVLHAPRRAK